MMIFTTLLLAAPFPQETTAAEAEASSQLDVYAGHWEGSIPGAKLEIDVDLVAAEDGTLSGDVSIPSQKISDQALQSFVLDGNALTFEIEGIPGSPTFVATLSEDGETLAGPFRQGGAELSFELKRVDLADPFPADDLAALRGWIDETIEGWEVPGVAVAVVTGDQVILADGFGVREVGGTDDVDPHTLFCIGSSSKAFTTLALGQAIDAGELSWTDTVRTHIPSFDLIDERAALELTVRDAVTHRLGLPRHDLMWYGRDDRTPAQLVDRMRYLEPNAGLRERFQYNNLGYVLAGEILHQATGTPWHEWIPSRIFTPLGMADSVTTAKAFAVAPNHSTGHGIDDDAVVTLPFRNIDHVGPAGSIGSSAHDMARWAQLHLRGGEVDSVRIVESSTLNDLHLPQQTLPTLSNDPMIGNGTYAHGWFVDSYRGHMRIQHGGNIDGFSAMVAFFPHDDLGVVCLANMNGSAVPEYVVRRTADLAFDLEPRGWSEGDLDQRAEAKAEEEKNEEDGEAEPEEPENRVEGTTPSRALDQFALSYEHAGYGEVTVTSGADGLSLTMGPFVMPLEHWHYDTFKVGETDLDEENPLQSMLVQFHASVEGPIDAITMKIEPMIPAVRFDVAADTSLEDPAVLAAFAGEYEVGDATLTVALRGSSLTASMPGQPTFTLVAGRDATFTLKEMDGFALHFVRGDDRTVTGVELRQPQGNFLAQRKVEDPE